MLSVLLSRGAEAQKPEGETCQNKYTQDEKGDVSGVTFLAINAISFWFFFWTAC